MLDWTDSYCRGFHRLLTQKAVLYTEMVTTGALIYGDVDRHLRYLPSEHPIALQLGGSNPEHLAQSARLAEDYGYDEVNLNVGCPSDRVQSGQFGACLMADPQLVADCTKAMLEAVSIPVTVKCRIGIDQQDDYADLQRFVSTVAESGVETFIVHARKAWLDGLSPKENRDIPPLNYERVYLLKQEFPQLEIIINGGITTLDEALVHLKQVDGVTQEPIERLFVDCDEAFMGVVTEKLSMRKGKMMNLSNNGSGRVRIEFSIPSRSLIGYRDEFLTDTRGTGIMNSYFSGYETYRGDFPSRFTGSIVSDRQGHAVPYALYNLEPRGRLFVHPGNPVYEGMVIGEHNRETDINVNPTKEKKLTNMRASGKDENVILAPIRPMTLEQAINFIREDELVEVTPKSVRMRKAILNAQKRHMMRASRFKGK